MYVYFVCRVLLLYSSWVFSGDPVGIVVSSEKDKKKTIFTLEDYMSKTQTEDRECEYDHSK